MTTPIVIPIENPSFTEGTKGWQFGNSSGVAQVGGESFAYAGYGGTFFQELTESPAKVQQAPGQQPGYYVEGFYALKFSVKNFFPSYPGKYDVELYYGTQSLGETYGWGTAAKTEVTVIIPSPGYMIAAKSLPTGPLQGQKNFSIHITASDGTANGGWTLLFKDFSLTFTPDSGVP
jgi:hypothetical protein